MEIILIITAILIAAWVYAGTRNEDDENNTSLVAVCPDFVSADKVKQGTKVVMGAPESAVFDIMHKKVIPILILIDANEYNKRKNEQ